MTQTLGELIRTRLEALDWKKADLARCMKRTESYIGLLAGDKTNSSKRGKTLPKPEVVRALSQCLQVSAAEILAAMGYLPQAEIGDVNERRLLESYRRLSPDLKKIAMLNMQGLDRAYGQSDSEPVVHAAVLPATDSRPATHTPRSALSLPPQSRKPAKKSVKKGASKKR